MKEFVFDISAPDELSAGLRGYNDRVTVQVDSGDPGGIQGEFENAVKQFLEEWFDGAKVRVPPAEPHIVIPEWMTSQQVEAINKLFGRNPNGSADRHAFFARVQNYGDYCGLGWCGIFIGIEKDGYTHS